MRFFKDSSWIFIFFITLLCSVLAIAGSQSKTTNRNIESAKATLKGSWHSPEWGYGFRIEGDKGYVTSWNNNYNPDDPTAKGDVVLQITEYVEDGFKGVHTFYDDSRIDVVARILDKNTIELSGRREVWKMFRQPSELN